MILQPEWRHLNAFGPLDVTTAKTRNGDNWVILDRTGKVLVETEWKQHWIEEFSSNGLARIVLNEPNPDGSFFMIKKVGWINTKGELVIPIEWSDAKDFDTQGHAAVERDGKWGWINEKGEVVIPFKWRFVNSFDSRGLATVLKGDYWGAIDRKGNVIIKPEWVGLYVSEERETVMARQVGGKVGEFSMTGELVVEPKWATYYDFDEKGHAKVSPEWNRWGLINREGEILFMKDAAGIADYDANDLAAIWTPNSMERGVGSEISGWINRAGEMVIEVPDRWTVLGSGEWGEAYVTFRYTEVEGVRKWMAAVTSWFKGDRSRTPGIYLCRAYDKHGNLIWSNTWLHRTTKAWFYLSAAMLALLVVLWLGRRRKKMVNQKS